MQCHAANHAIPAESPGVEPCLNRHNRYRRPSSRMQPRDRESRRCRRPAALRVPAVSHGGAFGTVARPAFSAVVSYNERPILRQARLTHRSAIEQPASTRYGSPFLTVPAHQSSHSFYEYGCHRIGVRAGQNG